MGEFSEPPHLKYLISASHTVSSLLVRPSFPEGLEARRFGIQIFFQKSKDNTFIIYYVTAPEGSEAAPHSQTLNFLQ